MVQELAEAEEARVNGRICALPDESTDLYAQAFGSFVLNPQQLTCNNPDHNSKTEIDDLQAKIDQFIAQAAVHAEEMEKLSNEVSQSQVFCLVSPIKMNRLYNVFHFDRNNCLSTNREFTFSKMMSLNWKVIAKKKR